MTYLDVKILSGIYIPATHRSAVVLDLLIVKYFY